jgi:hypothetical protein
MDPDYKIYREENQFAESLTALREIRRQGRLCDIILKVIDDKVHILVYLHFYSYPYL